MWPALVAEHLGLRRDGDAWSGHMSQVWPVRDSDDRPLALKVATATDARLADEAAALAAWANHGAVELVSVHRASTSPDVPTDALLLERLDGDRSLDSEADVDAAVDVIAHALGRLHAAPVPDHARETLRPMIEQTQSLQSSIENRARAHPDVLDASVVARAVDGIGLIEERYRATEPVIVHWDLHFLNLLAGGCEPWTVIDPLPYLGIAETELVPLLRNRWQGATAAGDLRIVLDRRIERASAVSGIDADLARRFAQAVATDNIGWMRANSARDERFAGAYEAMLRW